VEEREKENNRWGAGPHLTISYKVGPSVYTPEALAH